MKIIFTFFTITLLFFSCDKKNDCNQYIACTEEFVSVSIELIDSAGNPYSLDSYKTIKKSSNEVVKINDDFSNDKYYPILNDSHKKETTVDGEIFVFEGLKNNMVVVSEEYIISADCCHINLVSGEIKIVL